VELIRSFEIEAYAIINKYDINIEIALEIEQYLNSEGIRLLARIPFDKEMVEAMVEGKTIVEYNPGSYTTSLIKETWINLTSLLHPPFVSKKS
jgi:MinD superfamily P-loop ATPase